MSVVTVDCRTISIKEGPPSTTLLCTWELSKSKTFYSQIIHLSIDKLWLTCPKSQLYYNISIQDRHHQHNKESPVPQIMQKVKKSFLTQHPSKSYSCEKKEGLSGAEECRQFLDPITAKCSQNYITTHSGHMNVCIHLLRTKHSLWTQSTCACTYDHTSQG